MAEAGFSPPEEYRPVWTPGGPAAAGEKLERGACGGICALCPDRERHSAARRFHHGDERHVSSGG